MESGTRSSSLGLTGTYLNGLEEIRLTSNIVEKSILQNFKSQRDAVVTHVLRNRRVWLCTSVATRLPFLQEGDNLRQEWVVVLDEAGFMKQYEVLMPLVMYNPVRLVLVGDPTQLACPTFSPLAQAWWDVPAMARVMFNQSSNCPREISVLH